MCGARVSGAPDASVPSCGCPVPCCSHSGSYFSSHCKPPGCPCHSLYTEHSHYMSETCKLHLPCGNRRVVLHLMCVVPCAGCEHVHTGQEDLAGRRRCYLCWRHEQPLRFLCGRVPVSDTAPGTRALPPLPQALCTALLYAPQLWGWGLHPTASLPFPHSAAMYPCMHSLLASLSGQLKPFRAQGPSLETIFCPS